MIILLLFQRVPSLFIGKTATHPKVIMSSRMKYTPRELWSVFKTHTSKLNRYILFYRTLCLLSVSIMLMLGYARAENNVPFTLEKSQNENQISQEYRGEETEERTAERKTPPYLINAAFGLGKNFHAFRAGLAYSPFDMPQEWEKWDFYVELAFYVLHRRVYTPKKLYILTLTPFVRHHFLPHSSFDPYWDIGVGGAYRDKKYFGNIPISTNLAFHIKTSLGFFPLGKKGPSLSVRWYHFSNARLKLPNHGIDINVNIALEYAF